MNTDPAHLESIPAVPESAPAPREPNGFRKIRVGPNGIRALINRDSTNHRALLWESTPTLTHFACS
jgi:hypothetical protein